MRRQVATVFVMVAFLTPADRVRGGLPLGSKFTYQGQLKEAGVPYTGDGDFVFRAFDAPAGGGQVGGTLFKSTVPVRNGLFEVELDFGAGVFTGQALWLEVSVDGVVLQPRHALNAAPFALYALDGPGSGLSPWDESGNDVAYLGGFVGIGTAFPQKPLHIRDAVPLLELQDGDSTGSGQVGYVRLSDANGSERGWMGYGSSQNSHLAVMNNHSDGNTYLGAGGAFRVAVTPAGDVGIRTIAPDVTLQVQEGTDAKPTDGGFIQAGASGGPNVVIDDNEIMARNNGSTSTLHLNNNGGDVVVGGGIRVIQESRINLGYETVTNSNTPNHCSCISASCPEGKRVIGGGCYSDNPNDPLTVSRPRNGTRWSCEYDQGTFGSSEITAYAICINVD